MKTGIPVTVPLFNVNDESVVVSAWLVPEGTRVEAGQPLVSIETSKVSVEIEAPESGYVCGTVSIGTEALVGSVLCYLAENAGSAAPTLNAASSTLDMPLPQQPGTILRLPTAPNGNGRSMRVTPMARKLMEAHGLSETQFSGQAMVRQLDVLELLNGGAGLANTAERSASSPESWPVTRLSEAARRKLTEQGLSETLFAGHGLVRARDIDSLISSQPSVSQKPAEVRDSKAASVPYRIETLSHRKRMEIKFLEAGDSNTLCSTVVVTIPTKGLRAAVQQADQIQRNATAIFIYEAARLLHDYPFFNAYYADGNAHLYDEVNIGFAIDAGLGLKVAVIHTADRKSIVEIAAEMQDLIVAYISDEMNVESLSGGTFTITDLSGEGVFTFNPLINKGQSAILGIGAEFFPPDSKAGMFNLILGFDHQLSEGRQAAKFLNSLASRLQSYESALTPEPPSLTANHAELCCARCLRTFDDLQQTSAFLVSTAERDGSTRLICTLCLHGF